MLSAEDKVEFHRFTEQANKGDIEKITFKNGVISGETSNDIISFSSPRLGDIPSSANGMSDMPADTQKATKDHILDRTKAVPAFLKKHRAWPKNLEAKAPEMIETRTTVDYSQGRLKQKVHYTSYSGVQWNQPRQKRWGLF